MKMTGNTILITGGGSGIGRGLAEAFHRLGNTVIVAGRRKAMLEETTAANPGMRSMVLDIQDTASIADVAAQVMAEFPALNVLINNAGMMQRDDAGAMLDDAQMVSIMTTNLLGPMRMTSALIEHLKGLGTEAAVMHVTSGLAFVPLATTSVYSASKAALHSYAMSQRFKLKGTGVRVVELAPPYVQTDLMGGASDPRAMRLDAFLAETMVLLGTGADEILVERVGRLRGNPGPGEAAFVDQFNEMTAAEPL